MDEFHWWARRELNSRSSPCQGDVITPRPRARKQTEQTGILNRIGLISADNFRNLPRTPFFRACTSHPSAAIGHLD